MYIYHGGRYAAYVCADTNGLSGIMSLFFCGITMGHYTKYNLSSPAMAVTSTGFHTCAFVAEAAVFTYLPRTTSVLCTHTYIYIYIYSVLCAL